MPTFAAQAINRFQNQNQNFVYTLDSFWDFRDGAWLPLSIDAVRAELVITHAQLGLRLPSTGGLAALLDELLLSLARPPLHPASLVARTLLLSAEQPLADLEHDNLLNALISGEPLLLPPAPGAREPTLLTLRAKWIWAMVALPRLNRSTSGLY